MSSWFFSSTPVSEQLDPVAKIYAPNNYYYLTNERCLKNLIEFHGHSQVINLSFESLPESGIVTAIPKEYIKDLTIDDFVVDIDLIHNDVSETFRSFTNIPLNKLYNENTFNSTEKLTLTFITANQPTIDLGDRLVILHCGEFIPKFTDEKIKESLNRAISLAAMNSKDASEFKVCHGETVMLNVQIRLTDDIKAKFTNNKVGTFILPEIPQEAPIEEPQEESQEEETSSAV